MNTIQSLALATLGTALASPQIAAQNRRPLERAIPVTSHVVIEFAGLAGCRASWQDHGLAAIFDHLRQHLPAEHRERMLRPWQQQARPRARRLLAGMDISPSTIRNLLQGPMAILLGRPTVASGVPTPSVAVLCDVSGHRQSAQWLLGRMTRMVGAERSREQVIEGVPCRVLHVGRPQVDRVFATLHSDRLLVSNSRGFFAECLHTLRTGQRSIADHAPYRTGRRHLQGRRLASLWIDTAPWMAALRPFLPYEADAIAKALGLGELRGLFLGAGTVGAVGNEVCHLGWTGAMSGLVRTAFAGRASFDAARMCSPDTVAFGAARIDPAALHQALRRVVEGLPDWMRQQLHRRMDRVKVDMKRVAQHLETLTGDVAIACTMPKMLPIPEVTVFAGVRDEAAVSRWLVQMMQRTRSESYRTQKFLDTDIHSVVVEMANDVGLAPCFACKDGVLMLSSHPRILKATLRRIQKGGPSLYETPGFQAAIKQVAGSTAFGYVDTGDLAGRLMGSPQVQTALRQNMIQAGLDPQMLPETAALRKSLASLVFATRVDAEGFTMTCRSPMGEGSVMAFAGYLLDLLLRDLAGREI